LNGDQPDGGNNDAASTPVGLGSVEAGIFSPIPVTRFDDIGSSAPETLFLIVV
jgi:hypothetical protein